MGPQNHSNKVINSISYVIVISILILSVLAMTNGITVKSLLLDEAFFVRNLQDFSEGLYYHSAPSAPLFYFFSYAIVSILGKSEWVYRLIPLICAVMGLLMMARYLWKNFQRYVALTAIFLLSTSTPLIHFSSNAHPYAVDFLSSALILILTYQYINDPSKKRWITWLIVSTLSICFSFTTLFVFTSSCLLILLQKVKERSWRELRQKSLEFIPSGLIIFFIIFFFVIRLSQNRKDLFAWEAYFPPSMIPWQFFKWAFFNTSEIMGYLFWSNKGGLIGIFIVLLGTAWLIRKKEQIWIPLYWGPILLSMFAAIFKKWPYGPIRVMLFSLPFFIILIASGLEFIWESMNTKWPKIITAVACVAILIPQSWTLKKGFEHIEDSEEAIRTLSKTIKPEIRDNDHFLIYYAAAVQFQFYFPEYTRRAIVQSWSDRGDPESLNRFITSNMQFKKGRFWLIFSHIQTNEDELMIDTAKHYGRLLKSYTYPGCRAFLLESH